MNILFKSPGLYKIKKTFLKPFSFDERKLFSFLSKSPSKILDVGCGLGDYSYEMSRLGHFVTGIDLSSFLIKEAKEKYGRIKKLEFKVGGLPNLKFSNSKFDYVVLINVIHHISSEISLKKCICECMRVSRKGVIIKDVLRPKKLILRILVDIWHYFTDFGERYLTIEEFKHLLRPHKYKILLLGQFKSDMLVIIQKRQRNKYLRNLR